MLSENTEAISSRYRRCTQPVKMYFPIETILAIQGSGWEDHCTCSMLGLMPTQSWRGTQRRGRATMRTKSIISQGEVKYL